MADADGFLASLRSSYQANDAYTLAAHLDPLDHAMTSRLKQGLQSAPHLRPSSYTSLCKTFFSKDQQFADFVGAYLLFVRDGHPYDPEDDELTPQSALNTFELFQTTYSLANSILATQEPLWFIPSLRKLANALSTFAFQADDLAEDFKNTQAGVAARLLTRSLGICAAERAMEWPNKRNATFFLANQTFKIYFRLNNLRMCDTVVKNTRDARDFLDTQFPKADRVTFAYYMGRMYLYQRRMRKAMLELRKAFSLCTNSQWKNRRLILVYLITASLPLGVFPSPGLLEEFELYDQYAPLIATVKTGHYRQCLEILDEWKDWHMAKGTYLLLRDKLEMICWRNVARKTLLITTNGNPQPGTAPPTLSLKSFLSAAQVAFPDALLDLDDVEAMCASLLDQGYVKAYIHQSMQILVLQKGQTYGFPPVSSVRMAGDEL